MSTPIATLDMGEPSPSTSVNSLFTSGEIQTPTNLTLEELHKRIVIIERAVSVMSFELKKN